MLYSCVNRSSNSVIGLLQPRPDRGDLLLQPLHLPPVGVALGPGGGGPLLHGLRLGDRRRRPATVLQILPLAAVDVRLPAQLGRPLEVALAVGRVAPIGQAAAVDPFGPARLRQRPIRRLLPRLAGRVQPIPGLGRPALARPATPSRPPSF